MLGGAELVEVSSDGEPGDKARFVRGVERALLDGRGRDRRPLGQGPAGGAARGAGDRRGAARARTRPTPGSAPAPRSTTCPRAPGSGPPACGAAPSCSPRGPTCGSSELHGNVDTRLRKLAEGELDAIVLAAAGLRRLGREDEIAFPIPAEAMTPAAGPGRAGRCRSAAATRRPRAAVGRDRRRAGAARADRRARRRRPARGDLRSPLGVHARVDGERRIAIDAFVGLPDGSEWLRDRVEGDADRAGRCSAPSSPSACSAPAPARSSTAPRRWPEFGPMRHAAKGERT